MIEGLGIDIVEISRLRRSIERFGDRFLRRIFTEKEIGFCSSRPDSAIHYASTFAAKEAFIKAIGVLPGGDMKLIETLRDASGRPRFVLHGLAADALGAGKSVHISLTHDGGHAAAVAIVESVISN